MGRQEPNILPELDFFVEAVVTTTCYFDTTLNTTRCYSLSVSTPIKLASRPPFSLWLTILLGVVVCVISLLTVFGNVVMILAFVIERKIRQPSNYFIVSLAVTDLIVGSFSMPLYSLYVLRGSWVLGHWLCDIWLSVDWSVFLTAIYTVLLMTLNRFFENRFPVKYRRWRSRKIVLVAIALLYMIPSVICFTLFITVNSFEEADHFSKDKCDVPFLKDVLFTCLFVIGYYWVTIVATGILHVANYQMFARMQNKSQENCNRVIESPRESSSQRSKEKMLNNTRHGQQKNNNSVSVHRVDELKLENTSKSMKVLKHDENVRPYLNGWGDLKKTTLVKGFGAYNYKSDCSEDVADSVFILNCETRDPKMRKDLLMTYQRTDTYQIGLQRLTSPSRLPPNSPDSMFQGNPSKELENLYSSSSSNRLERQTTPLLPLEVRRRSQIIIAKSPPTILSSMTAALIPTTGESEEDDMNTTDLHTSNIWKRRSPLPALFSDVFDMENVNHRLLTTGLTATTDFPIGFTAHMSNSNRFVLHQQHLLLDMRNPEIFIRVSDGGTQPHNGQLGGVGVREDSPGSSNNNNNNDLDITDSTNAAQHSNRSSTSKTIIQDKISTSSIDDVDQGSDVDAIPDQDPSSSKTSHQSAKKPTGNKSSDDHVFVRSNSSIGHRRKETYGRKSLRPISLLLVSYILCWSPYHVLAIMLALCTSCVNMRLYSLTYWLCYLSSCINPICNALANPQTKRAVIRVLTLDWNNPETVV